jgi:hypothetical protein
MCVVLLLGVMGCWIGYGQAEHRPWTFGLTQSPWRNGEHLAVPPLVWVYLAALLVAGIVMLWVIRHALMARRLTPAGFLLLAVCAVVMLGRQALHGGRVGFAEYIFRPGPRVDFHAKSAGIEALRERVAANPARVMGLASALFPGWASVYGLETTHSVDALSSPLSGELVGTLSSLDRTNVAAMRKLHDALNVRYYVSARHPADGDLSPEIRRILSADVDAYESATAWPRAFFTDRIVPCQGAEEFRALVNQGDGRPFAALEREAYAKLFEREQRDRSGAATTTVEATNYRLTAGTTAFSVQAPGRGIVVLTENFWAGDFRCTVNGEKAPILRVNHAFKGVLVPAAGSYRITFRYVPRNWPRNLMLCGVGCVLWAGVVGWSIKRSREHARRAERSAADRPGFADEVSNGAR